MQEVVTSLAIIAQCQIDTNYTLAMMLDEMLERKVKTIPVPNNATNGDMIKAMFPNAQIVHGLYGISGTPMICLSLDTRFDVYEMSFVEDWWHAPYKEVENSSNQGE